MGNTVASIGTTAALAPISVMSHLPWGATLVGVVFWIGHSYFQTYLNHIETMAKIKIKIKTESEERAPVTKSRWRWLF